MSFVQLNRGPKVKVKARRVADGEIALKWWANPTAPFLGIAIGEDIARAIGIISYSQRVDLLIGEGEDAGKLCIRKAENGSWWFRIRGHQRVVFLDSDVSQKHFAMFPGDALQSSGIQFSAGAVTFDIPASARKGG